MASEAEMEVGAVDAAAATVASAEEVGGVQKEKQPHKLERKWTFWYDNQSKPKIGGWGSSLRKVYTFDTVEEFWCLHDQIFKPSRLAVSADIHLFKAGVEPKWEDPECANGGKWTIICSNKPDFDDTWSETLMGLIGEQFEDSDEICGVVASFRPQRQDRIALWTKTAANEAAQMAIGKKWKEIVGLSNQIKINYNFHDDARSNTRGGLKTRYTV